MAMFKSEPVRPEAYKKFERETPEWYQDAKLGIFVHWGPYSVPAWAEPIGPLGTFDEEYWFRHNPYAEWYYNTVRIEGSTAHQHQQEVFDGAPYDAFIDLWKAENFDAGAVMDLVKSTGARYFVPTTKHHDGVALWDAPGTGDRNTVQRGPHRDLVAEFKDAAEARGVRFGVYYSGGLDWHFTDAAVIDGPIEGDRRPVDKEYADYAHDHVVDLIEKYQPEVLWGDIEWPDAGKAPGEKSLVNIFEKFYASRPDGVSNDRWGETHWDFRTSEYEQGRAQEGDGAWENCRGVGFSFGHNTLEDESNSLSGVDAIRNFVDIVSRGGNFLLNIGLTASGEVPELQRHTLETLGAWNAVHGDAVFGSRPLDPMLGAESDTPWVRWTRTGGIANAFVDLPVGETVALEALSDRLDLAGAEVVGATSRVDGDTVTLVRADGAVEGLVRVSFPIRGDAEA
ncbi:alpha-L-fucosidase [Pseudoclavibacter sp. RFBG4]|uniref:alpha-L-fucosidase n=1 Tax=Pseudoclavibacter sp. RFBG4 TaxID=2080575 RepID=UPI000CE71D2C|nr:alpha-L-fucosidase [Pseudoclavibacter sp. RFBG4]PPG26793.1 alpha-L-fucosidase [Pseudoclavibacter sp. RFBG4]